MPDIAVAITTYNQAMWIEQTLASVFSQSLAPAEVVVIDDGSTDGTPAILNQFRDRARIIRQPNGGVAAARNAAVLACSTDYVALLDGDDLWHRHKLQRCAELLDTCSEPSLLAHDVERVSPRGDVIDRGEIAARLAEWDEGPAPVLNCLEQLIHGNFIWTTSQVVVRRNAYIAVGLSDPSFPIASDYDLYLRLAAHGPFLLCSDVLTQWRQHDASASGRASERQFNWAVDIARVLRKARTYNDMANNIEAIDRRQSTIIRNVYRSEPRFGRWATARALARIAWHCRSVYGGFAAGAVLLSPQSVRRAMASATGLTISTKVEPTAGRPPSQSSAGQR